MFGRPVPKVLHGVQVQVQVAQATESIIEVIATCSEVCCQMVIVNFICHRDKQMKVKVIFNLEFPSS